MIKRGLGMQKKLSQKQSIQTKLARYFQLNQCKVKISFLWVIALLSFIPCLVISDEIVNNGKSKQEARLYQLGKNVYVQKIVCGKCILAGKMLDKSSATELLQGHGVAAKTVSALPVEERAGLEVFLRHRFKI